MKALGINWNANKDVIQYLLVKPKSNSFNKRTILSAICQIFDPFGVSGPVIVFAKLIIRELWKLKVSWDEKVPGEIKSLWLLFQEELESLNVLRIPRHCLIYEYIFVELHRFAGAFEKACMFIHT